VTLGWFVEVPFQFSLVLLSHERHQWRQRALDLATRFQELQLHPSHEQRRAIGVWALLLQSHVTVTLTSGVGVRLKVGG